MRRESTQWRVRCVTDGNVYVTLPTSAPAPTLCPNDPAHQVLRVSLSRYVGADFDPVADVEGVDSLVVTGVATKRNITPITSPAGWLANAAGQLLVQG